MMMKKQIEISVDVFAAIWSARLPHESSEDHILARLLRLKFAAPKEMQPTPVESTGCKTIVKSRGIDSKPLSKKWTDVLVWTLEQLGRKATLDEIYKKSREGRSALGILITPEHDASARECLESHCGESSKFRHKADLFRMPEGKGAGIWALR
jgi:hypothetical protein